MEKRTKINIGVLVSICILSICIILSSAEVTYHTERLATSIIDIDGGGTRYREAIPELGIWIVEPMKINSVNLQLFDYGFDGNALGWHATDKNILFTGGCLSNLTYKRLADMPIWYDIEYKEISNIFGTSYHVIDAKVVEPSIVYTIGGNSELKWEMVI